ncbi:MAG TPA: lysophospholipid acyltransferase family protein, partial [Actinomycetales bacterium]|nr:lysophospholipid acyltransferase family protein [Actinomycetales bacterium]
MADLVYPPVIRAALVSFKALGMTIDIDGLENVPATGGAVVASNHVSYLDFIFAGLAPWKAQRRLTRFMAKDAVFRHRVSGPLMRGMHHIPVDRDAGSSSMRAALRALSGGELVGLFPEATISRSFTVKELKSGTVRMAAAARVPILPTVVWGGQRMFGKGHPRSFARGRTITISVGEPISVTTRDDMAAATEQLRTTLQALLDGAQGLQRRAQLLGGRGHVVPGRHRDGLADRDRD